MTRHLQQHAPVAGIGSWSWSPITGEARWSDGVYAILGVDPAGGPLPTDRWLDIVHPDDHSKVESAMAQMDHDARVVFDCRITRSDGSWRRVRFGFHSERDDDGGVTLVRGTVQNLSELSNLADDQMSLWHAFEDAPAGVVVVSLAPESLGVCIRANKAFARMLGRTADDLVGVNPLEVTHPDDRALDQANFEAALTEGRGGYVVEKRYVRSDGSVFSAVLRVSLVRDAEGEPLYGVAHVVDVTARKRVEADLRRSEEGYRRLIQTTTEGVWMLDADDRTVFINDRMCELFRASREQLIGQHALDRVHPSQRVPVAEQLANRHHGEPGEYELPLLRADGTEFPGLISSTPYWDDEGNYAGSFGMLNDITETKEAGRLRAQLAAIVDSSDDVVISVGSDGRIQTWNAAAEAMWGMDAAEAVGKVLHDVVTPPDLRPYLELLETRVFEGEVVRDIAVSSTGRDGRRVYLSLTLTPLRDETGDVVAIAGIGRDITERIDAERRIAQSEQRYREIVETANEGIWVGDCDGIITFANARLAELAGCSVDEVIGRPATDFSTNPARDRLHYARALRGELGPIQTEFVHRDGHAVPILASTTPLRDDDGGVNGVLVMAADLSERVEAQRAAAEFQAQLAQFQKLETVGRLAGGIAHDFNNLLAVILNYAEFAQQSVGDHPASEDIAEIKAAAERAADLTQQLLLFGRRQVTSPQAVDVNQLLGEIERLITSSIGEHVDVRISASPRTPHACADRTQVEQVIMNLALNARDAMPSGGEVKIATRRCVDEGGTWVRLTVSDNGAGMAPETRERIFEPFFTTKDVGSGTGLGLATVYGIVATSRGRINVDSALGAGTTVTVDLPAWDEAPGPVAVPASGDAVA